VGSIPYEIIEFVNLSNLDNRNMAQGSTQPLTEMSAKNLPGGKERAARKVDTSPPSVSRLSRKYRSLNVSQAHGPPWSVTGISLLFYLVIMFVC
jgi:hypothetical protein